MIDWDWAEFFAEVREHRDCCWPWLARSDRLADAEWDDQADVDRWLFGE